MDSPWSPAPGPALTIVVRRDGPCCEVLLAGELDVATGPQVVVVGGDLVARGEQRIVLDLTALRFCDVRGLAAVRHLACELRRCGGVLTLRGPSVPVRSLLRRLGLDRTLLVDDGASSTSRDGAGPTPLLVGVDGGSPERRSAGW